ncbi:hypothetical protein BJX65DRAFT_303811 [Aspergillus insuetus]
MRAINLSLGILFLIASTSIATKTTTIGLETEETSRGVIVPMDDCFGIDEYEVYTVAITKKCRFFAGPMCTGRNALLQPGEHSSKDPVPVGSVLCEEPDLI